MGKYSELFDKMNYDIRETGDARWIDQKCTYDVLCIIADCIIEYVDRSGEPSKEFTVSDIWHSQYAVDNVVAIFSKPDPDSKASNEYDKYFGQPIKLFSYSGLLTFTKKGNKYYYRINEREIMENIALRPLNALDFLSEYITKVLSDSGIYEYFESFFNIQTKDEYKVLREKFISFTIANTKINGKTEVGRIFTKVINPLAFKLKKKGTERGYISKNTITLSDLQYNRANWRDELSGKDKSVTRMEHESDINSNRSVAMTSYTVNKAKKALRKYNDMVFEGASEVYQVSEKIRATQAHHIFTQSDYPEIANYLENLIMLTPNQHFGMAHPDNNTIYIDKDFQYICLIAKAGKIMENLSSNAKYKIYDFDDYKYVLNTGFSTEDFFNVKDKDFNMILSLIDQFSLYDNEKNRVEIDKYKDLIELNYPENIPGVSL